MAISDAGKEVTAALLIGNTGSSFGYLAIGSDSVQTNSLGYEFTGSGAARVQTSNSLITTSVTNDTAQFIGSWTIAAPLVITEWGLFNDDTAGNSLALANIGSINAGSGDIFQLTVKVQVS